MMNNKYITAFITLFFIIYFLYYYINNITVIIESKEDQLICYNNNLWNYNLVSYILSLLSIVFLSVRVCFITNTINNDMIMDNNNNNTLSNIIVCGFIFILNLAFFIWGICEVIEYEYCRHGNIFLWFFSILDILNHFLIISLFIFITVKISCLFVKNKIQNEEYLENENIESKYIITEI